MSKVFRVIGSTDDCTQCELCGRDELKGTVVLAELDADGSELGYVYYGTSCAAKAAGWTAKHVRTEVRDADRARREAEHAERMRAMAEQQAVERDWIEANIGPGAYEHPEKYGYRSRIKVLKVYHAAMEAEQRQGAEQLALAI